MAFGSLLRKGNPLSEVQQIAWMNAGKWVLVLTTIGFYGMVWKAGLNADWTGMAERIETSRGAIDILSNFGFPSNQQLLNLFLYLSYQFFGNNPLAWSLLFIACHLLNGILFYYLLRHLFRAFYLSEHSWVIWLGTALFLLNPYQNEPVVWKACLNWLLSTACILGGLLSFMQWREHNRVRHLLWVHLFFLAGIFLLEQALVFPLYLLVLVFSLPNRQFSWRRILIRLAIPQLLIVGGYLVLNKLTLGTLVGHYGPSVHLKFDLLDLGSTLLKYVSRVVLWSRYSFRDTASHYALFDQDEVVWTGIGVFLILLMLMIFFWKRLSAQIKLSGILFLFAIIAFLPVLNLFFYYLLYIENDRYSYLPSGFLLTAIFLLVDRLPWLISRFIGGLYLLGSLYFLVFCLQIWQENTTIMYSLLESFPLEKGQTTYVLNVPDNNRGCRLFRDYGAKAGLESHLVYTAGRSVPNEIIEVMYYNLTDKNNGVKVHTPRDSTIRVEFAQYGNWWWRFGKGGTRYENDIFRVVPEEQWGQLYDWEIKAPPLKGAVIYQDSLQWKPYFDEGILYRDAGSHIF